MGWMQPDIGDVRPKVSDSFLMPIPPAHTVVIVDDSVRLPARSSLSVFSCYPWIAYLVDVCLFPHVQMVLFWIV